MPLITSSVWFLFTSLLLLWLQPRLHKEVQMIFLLITRNRKVALLLFSLIFFPGVFLHEASHFLMAKILFVRTGRFSIFPRDLGNGRMRMGFVEIAKTDPVRESLIGAAPLLAGSAFVAYVGISRLGINQVWAAGSSGELGEIITGFFGLFTQPDVWLWLYLALTVSGTMFPSASDRQPWLKTFLGILIILGVLLLFGLGGWLAQAFGPGIIRALDAAAVVFGLAAALHLLFLGPLVLLRRLLNDLFP